MMNNKEKSELELNNDKNLIKNQQIKKKFDVDCICSHFENFNKGLQLDHYINGYKELSIFFDNLGTIFSFVASDVSSKLIILENYLKDGEKGKYYYDLKSMIDYEKKERLFKTTKNGTRNLLRLHRALQFISEFLNEVTKLDENENTSTTAIKAYEHTLMKYHGWIVSNAAKLAMYTLPVRSGLVQRVFGHKEQLDKDQINESMIRIAELTEKSFNLTQELFEENDLLNLA